MRRILSTIAVAGLGLALAACGGGAKQEASKDPQSVSGEITWWDTSDATNEAPAFKELVDGFQQKYPKVKVNVVNVPFDQAREKFKTAAQGGKDAPDVIRAEVAWTPEFAKLGYLAPLDGKSALDKTDDFLPVPASSTKLDGKTYAVPSVTDTLALLYNKDLLKKAGVEKPPATMDELKTVAKTIKDKAGADGFYVNSAGYFVMPFIYGEGGDLLDVGAKKITVDSEKARAGVEKALDLVKTGAAPKPALTEGYNNMQTLFKDGKVAMIFNGPWSVAEDLKGKAFANKENLGVAPVPAGSSKAGAPVGGHNLGVYAGSKNLDASYLFVQYMTSAESQAKIAGKLGLLPTRKSAYASPEATGNSIVAAFKAPMDKAVERAWIPEAGDLFRPLDTNYTKILGGQSTAEQGLKATAEEYRKLLKGWS